MRKHSWGAWKEFAVRGIENKKLYSNGLADLISFHLRVYIPLELETGTAAQTFIDRDLVMFFVHRALQSFFRINIPLIKVFSDLEHHLS